MLTPRIMKLHRYIDHDSQMTPIDFQVTRSKVKVTLKKLQRTVYNGWPFPAVVYGRVVNWLRKVEALSFWGPLAPLSLDPPRALRPPGPQL
ncbi:hypothetical protein DPMN_187620 [Dreissena polymorpha]|uniref:Uncharacterized protein n=1 Tax=Dreissena polymorpha TaxID=45954 RepID=A0A9D4DRY8_DREPO|nr:hypothetical protein DPMN_187620 [Dreissena polymorpha]